MHGIWLQTAQLLTTARDIASFNRPAARDYQSVKSYFDEEAPVCTVESYIYWKEDIITLKPGRETAWLDAFIERVLQKLSSRFIRVRVIYPAWMRLDYQLTISQYIFCSPVSRPLSVWMAGTYEETLGTVPKNRSGGDWNNAL
jgi:hypothetical protein